MTFLRLLPAFLCGLLLGAHYLRTGSVLLLLLCAAAPGIAFARRPWARNALWAFLAFAAIEWVLTARHFTAARIADGEPWVRMAWILGGVASFNLLAAALLTGSRMRAYFRIELQ